MRDALAGRYALPAVRDQGTRFRLAPTPVHGTIARVQAGQEAAMNRRVALSDFHEAMKAANVVALWELEDAGNNPPEPPQYLALGNPGAVARDGDRGNIHEQCRAPGAGAQQPGAAGVRAQPGLRPHARLQPPDSDAGRDRAPAPPFDERAPLRHGRQPARRRSSTASPVRWSPATWCSPRAGPGTSMFTRATGG